MKGFAITAPAGLDEAGGYEAPFCRTAGQARGALLGLGSFPLWALRGRLGVGARVRWGDDHGDEAIYVLKGGLGVDDRTCPEGGVLIVESGARAEVIASSETQIVHFGPHDPAGPRGGLLGPPEPVGHSVHVIGPGAMYSSREPDRDTRLFADSTCDRCRLFLLLTGREGEFASSRHSHSADEVIYVLRGELRFGSHSAGPGQAVAIAGGVRYSFRSGPSGFSFLNYRADASEQTVVGRPPLLEGGLACGLALIGDVR